MPVAQGAPAAPPDDVIIDIPYANLHEWCIQRKLMNPNWRKLLQEVQTQVKTALASLPEVQGVSTIKSISKLDYYQCKQVRRMVTLWDCTALTSPLNAGCRCLV